MSATYLHMLDRAAYPIRRAMAAEIAKYIAKGEAVDVLDSSTPGGRELRYQVRRRGTATHIFDGPGRHKATFADPIEAVMHAEKQT